MIIQRLKIEGGVDIQVTITGDGITQAGAIIEFRTTYPSIMGVIRGICIHSVEDRQFVEG